MMDSFEVFFGTALARVAQRKVGIEKTLHHLRNKPMEETKNVEHVEWIVW